MRSAYDRKRRAIVVGGVIGGCLGFLFARWWLLSGPNELNRVFVLVAVPLLAGVSSIAGCTIGGIVWSLSQRRWPR